MGTQCLSSQLMPVTLKGGKGQCWETGGGGGGGGGGVKEIKDWQAI